MVGSYSLSAWRDGHARTPLPATRHNRHARLLFQAYAGNLRLTHPIHVSGISFSVTGTLRTIPTCRVERTEQAKTPMASLFWCWLQQTLPAYPLKLRTSFTSEFQVYNLDDRDQSEDRHRVRIEVRRLRSRAKAWACSAAGHICLRQTFSWLAHTERASVPSPPRGKSRTSAERP